LRKQATTKQLAPGLESFRQDNWQPASTCFRLTYGSLQYIQGGSKQVYH